MSNKKSFNKYAVATMAAATATAAVVPAAVSADTTTGFPDVSDNNNHKEAIAQLVDEEVIQGYADGTFGPYDNVYRGQVAVMLYEKLGLKAPKDLESALAGYDDVDADHRYAPQIAAVTEAGIFSGKGDNFKPYTNITRQQMATALVDGFNLEQYNTDEDVDIDLSKVSSDHEKNVQILANLGITNQLGDKEDNNYEGYDSITRAQFATFLVQASNVVSPEITGLESPEDVTVTKGGELELPKTVKATYNNDTTKDVEVNWNMDEVDVNEVGTYEVPGTVEGTDEVVTVNVVVEETDAVQEATSAVEKAENSLKQEDVDAAQELVDNLDKSDEKTLLNARIADVEDAITSAVNDVEKAGNEVTLYKALNQAPFEKVNKDNIADYKTEIDKLSDYSVVNIQDAINRVNDEALREEVDAANTALGQVDYTTNQTEEAFNNSVQEAQKAIDELPADYVQGDDETPLAEKLQADLDEQKSLYNDYVNKVQPVVNGKDQIAKFEALQANFDNAVENNIGKYDFTDMTTVEEIQNEVDEVNAQQAVTGLTGEDLTQENIDAAQKLVDRLSGTVEDAEADDYNETKAGLVDDIKAAQDKVDAEANLAAVTETVEGLTTTNDADETVLAEGVNQDAIDAAQEEVTALEDGDAKTELQTSIDKAQNLLDASNLEAATEAVEGLTDKEGNLVADQAAIDAAQDLLDATAEDADSDNALQNQIDVAQDLLDTAAINNATRATELQPLLVDLGNKTYNNLNKAQRSDVTELFLNNIPEEGFADTNAVSEALDEAIGTPAQNDTEATGYYKLLADVNNATNNTEARDALMALENDEFKAMGANEKLTAAENVLDAKPENGYTSISQIVNNF